MKRAEYGVWEITIPPNSDGTCAIPHDSKIKASPRRLLCAGPGSDPVQITMITTSRERIERLPAWIRRVTQDLNVSPAYDARFWNPPVEDRYKFKNHAPPTPKSLRIYEAHVGISTSEHRVGTYVEFTRDILPRIKKLGYNTIQLMAIMEHAYYACNSPSPLSKTSILLSAFQPLDTR